MAVSPLSRRAISCALAFRLLNYPEATQNVHAIYLATLLQNELKSDDADLPPK